MKIPPPPVASVSFLAMPETHSMRKVHWQFFVTLTFRHQLHRAARISFLFAWLRDVAATDPKIHFKSLLWLYRYEIGPLGGTGHYHLCIAGKSAPSVTVLACRNLQRLWHCRTRALAEVTPYDHARDGVGYILKLPTLPQSISPGQGMIFRNDNDETHPTLSKSLFAAIRRGRM